MQGASWGQSFWGLPTYAKSEAGGKCDHIGSAHGCALSTRQVRWSDWCEAGVAPVQVEVHVNGSLEIVRKMLAILS